MPQRRGSVQLNNSASDLTSGGITAAAKPKPAKAKPSKQHCFTAEMDLAAAGFLQPPASALAVADTNSTDSEPSVSYVRDSVDESQPTSRRRNQQHQQIPSQHQKHSPRPAQTHRPAQMHRQADSGGSSEELSPGAKALLRETGLMSEEQQPAQSQQRVPGGISHQLPAGEAAEQQDRLLAAADAAQQLDTDSICRLSDSYQQPAKRSKSCPADGCHAEQAQQSGSQTLSEAVAQDVAADSDPDEAMSEHQSALLQAEPSMVELQECGFGAKQLHQQEAQQQEGMLQQQPQQEQEQHPDALVQRSEFAVQTTAKPAGLMPAASPRSPQAHPAPMHHDSLDMTQPNLTPFPQSAARSQLPNTNPNGNTAPKGHVLDSTRSRNFAALASLDARVHDDAAQVAGLPPQRHRTQCTGKQALRAQHTAAAAAQPRLSKTPSGKRTCGCSPV